MINKLLEVLHHAVDVSDILPPNLEICMFVSARCVRVTLSDMLLRTVIVARKRARQIYI